MLSQAWFKENQTKQRKKEFKSEEKGLNLIIQRGKNFWYPKKGERDIFLIASLKKLEIYLQTGFFCQ